MLIIAEHNKPVDKQACYSYVPVVQVIVKIYTSGLETVIY